MEKQRSSYNEDELKVFEKRAVEYIKNKPNANRTRICKYVGVGIGILERLEKNGNFKLPEPLTSKQQRKLSDWGNMLGELGSKWK
tara:strand:- start:230 stop:484 length:255 start_codon:yes stop_codon:yes gene_type:complete